MAKVSPLIVRAIMPSGLHYDQRELNAAERWWGSLINSQRWWMMTAIFPNNPITHRVRAAIGPLSGKVDTDGNARVDFAIIAYGSTEIEAKIHVMRQTQKITNQH